MSVGVEGNGREYGSGRLETLVCNTSARNFTLANNSLVTSLYRGRGGRSRCGDVSDPLLCIV